MIRHRAVAALGAIVAALCLAAPPAHAAAPEQALALCQGAPRGCSLEARGSLREGTTSEVTVIGNPHVRVQVVVYNAIIDDGRLTALEPISKNAEVFTNADGVAHTEVTIPALKNGISSGWALLSIGGLTGVDTSLTVGQFMPFASRIPTVLGDGWAAGAKPVGQFLDLHFVGAAPGSSFAVEHLDEAGNWQLVSTGSASVSPEPHQASRIDYQVPRGLVATPHKFRLRNLSDSGVAPIWLGTPATDGAPEARTPIFTPPPVGDGLDGTQLLTAHPQDSVRAVSLGIGAVALAAVVGHGALRGLRRPRWRRP
ncbi:hypothetical protein [Tessaracoccus sp. OH4464_COT-324]|uniref:hypothetical protein n=1 Tax=Tessaracoccus sp. OH4464_COT-324 TaxID=2491059 RepID=UPI000F63A4A3|nr:hypothetical protein [Tessaracoccus sp. OH4464_COT-324]RRD45238.1 hypothetical protein EII42_11425 [Tessaracoccus sp. OH4464_COT-324]